MRIDTWFTALAVGALLAAPEMAAQAQDKAEVALRAAMEKETVEGNLKAAIDEYKKLAQNTNKAVAARALVQLGECYEKQGNVDARKTYELVLSRFGDQTEAVGQARARLAKLGGDGAATQPATRLVWAGSKADGDSVSPDGRYLSYTDWDTGNLVLHDIVSDTDGVLTANGNMGPGPEAFADGSVFSRDGKQVAYAWYDDTTKRDEPWVADLNGDPHQRRLFDGDASPDDWSPDGKWIVVSAGDEHTDQVAILPAQGGTPRVLKSWPAGGRRILSASFSPDGKYIVYAGRMADGSHRGYILSADGKSEIALAPESFDTHDAKWSPDGSRIVWVSGEPATASRVLWAIRVANGKPVGEPDQLIANFGNSFLTGFARDGSLFYGASLPESDIYLAGLDPATGKLTSLPKRVNEHGLGSSNGRIAWLPDGKSLSFWSTREGRPALVVHTLATGEERELWEQPTGAGGPGYAGWFPDGSVMAWQRNAQSLVYRRLDSRTLEARATWTVPFVPSPGRTGISRDLMTMFIPQKDEAVPCEGRICTYVMLARDLQTGKDRQICRFTAGGVGNLSRSVSPDGRELAFTMDYQGHRSVMIAPTAGGTPREIYRDESGYRLGDTLDWTQDGSHLLAFYAEPGRGELWSFPVKGGPPEKSALQEGFQGLNIGLNTAVSPDGTQFAFVGGGRKPQVWVMPSPFPSAKTAAAR